jgi:L-alanine-DL-glutamate epimerase-like enolase superfamily enzyme
MELQVYQFRLALRYPFSISRHTYDSIETLIVELIDKNLSGFGEATVNPYYNISPENLITAFSMASELIEDYTFHSPAELWNFLQPHMKDNFFALSAIDCAAHDLFGKLKGRSFGNQYGIDYSKFPFTSYTLGIGSMNEIRYRVSQFPWPVYKVKLGSENDLDIIRDIRNYTQSLLRVDANGAWTLDQAMSRIDELSKINVEFIEQPLPDDRWEEMKKLKSISAIPLIADESCVYEADIEKCHTCFHGINIKLSKCGGLTPALRMIEQAKRLGMKVMIGCMTESTVGISAAAQLLPLVDYADLDGPLLLRENVATGVKYKNGCLIMKRRSGLGLNFRYEKVQPDLIDI